MCTDPNRGGGAGVENGNAGTKKRVGGGCIFTHFGIVKNNFKTLKTLKF
eukprot:SAG22_NODE_2103_length_3009_cov_6.486254_2_plen_49_part_00